MSAVLAPVVFAMHLSACSQQYPVVLQAPTRRHLAHAMAESGLHLTAIRDNTTGRSFIPETQAEAVAIARQLLAAGHRLDAGIMQVTDRASAKDAPGSQWAHYGLTVETAFDAPANICAGARILGEDWSIERRTACRYQTGKPDCATGYPEMVQKAELRIQQAVDSADAEPASQTKPTDERYDLSGGDDTSLVTSYET